MDPFTGGGSYRPTTGTNNTYGGASGGDPLTGGGSYRPASSTRLLPIVSGYHLIYLHRLIDTLSNVENLFDIKTSCARCCSQKDPYIEQRDE